MAEEKEKEMTLEEIEAKELTILTIAECKEQSGERKMSEDEKTLLRILREKRRR